MTKIAQDFTHSTIRILHIHLLENIYLFIIELYACTSLWTRMGRTALAVRALLKLASFGKLENLT